MQVCGLPNINSTLNTHAYFLFFPKAKSTGRPCEYDNKIYQNGEIFRPNCKHQCTCIDGAVGCSSLCPLELALPKLGCSKPRLVKVAGHCCEKLVCPEESKTAGAVIKKLKMAHEHSEDDLTIRNELVSGVRGGGLKSLPGKWLLQSKQMQQIFSSRKLSHTYCSRTVFRLSTDGQVFNVIFLTKFLSYQINIDMSSSHQIPPSPSV